MSGPQARLFLPSATEQLDRQGSGQLASSRAEPIRKTRWRRRLPFDRLLALRHLLRSVSRQAYLGPSKREPKAAAGQTLAQLAHAFLQSQRPWQLARYSMGSKIDEGLPGGWVLRQFVGIFQDGSFQ
jgi:hypothetical protein